MQSSHCGNPKPFDQSSLSVREWDYNVSISVYPSLLHWARCNMKRESIETCFATTKACRPPATHMQI